MSQLQRLVLALGIVVIDAVAFVVPLAALFLAYVIIVNPPWFRDFLNDLDRPRSGG
jgi:hypothetical protein